MRPREIQIYIGKRLARERAKLDYTQQEFADLIGCSQPQYGRYENGERSISATDLQQLAEKLQIAIEEFFPSELRDDVDDAERRLLEAWRSRELVTILKLVGERFSR